MPRGRHLRPDQSLRIMSVGIGIPAASLAAYPIAPIQYRSLKCPDRLFEPLAFDVITQSFEFCAFHEGEQVCQLMKICRSDILYAHDAPPTGVVAAMPEKPRGTPYLAQRDAVSPSRKVTATAPTRPRSARSPVLDRDISTMVSAGLFSPPAVFAIAERLVASMRSTVRVWRSCAA